MTFVLQAVATLEPRLRAIPHAYQSNSRNKSDLILEKADIAGEILLVGGAIHYLSVVLQKVL
jgi:hypothetical protein